MHFVLDGKRLKCRRRYWVLRIKVEAGRVEGSTGFGCAVNTKKAVCPGFSEKRDLNNNNLKEVRGQQAGHEWANFIH